LSPFLGASRVAIRPISRFFFQSTLNPQFMPCWYFRCVLLRAKEGNSTAGKVGKIVARGDRRWLITESCPNAGSGRNSEIGIRIALGAQRGSVLCLILRESLLPVLVAVAIGLPSDIRSREVDFEFALLSPPDADKALPHLNRALQVSNEDQGKIAGDRQLILTHVYSALGDGYLAKASQLATNRMGTEAWRQRKEAYTRAAKYFELASGSPSGFASEDARVYSMFAEVCEGLAQMEAQQLASTTLDQRDALIRARSTAQQVRRGDGSRPRSTDFRECSDD
jgi:hypothetical protein